MVSIVFNLCFSYGNPLCVLRIANFNHRLSMFYFAPNVKIYPIIQNAIAKDIYEAAVYGDVAIVKRLLKSATFADLIYKNPNDVRFEPSFQIQ